jgi:hypothetical protein
MTIMKQVIKLLLNIRRICLVQVRVSLEALIVTRMICSFREYFKKNYDMKKKKKKHKTLFV